MSRVVPRELRVTRVEEHHGRWYKWHRVCKNSQLGISMGKATVSLELTVANILKVLTNLRLVVTVQRANDLRPREVSRHGVVEVALFAETVSKWTHFAKGAGACLLKMSAQSRLIFLPSELIMFANISFLVVLFRRCNRRLGLVLLFFWGLRRLLRLRLREILLARNRVYKHSWWLMLSEVSGRYVLLIWGLTKARRHVLRKCLICHHRHQRY